MRHPIWQLTGLLSIGLAGCLHGQDWRAVVRKPTVHAVAERRQSTPVPKTVGRIRSASTTFVPPPAPPAAQPALPSVAPPENKNVRTDTTVVEQRDMVPSAPNSSKTLTLPAVAEHSPSTSFAEFERAIVPQTVNSVSRSVPAAATRIDAEVITQLDPKSDAVEVTVPDVIEPKKAITLPLIIPAGRLLPSNPKTVESLPPQIAERAVPAAAEPPRALFSKSAVSAKELPAVTDATATPAKASPSAEAERPVSPQDVSVLVQQVFEDLRQRRLSDARTRTDWLKQLVMKRVPVNHSRVNADESAAESVENSPGEPRTLTVDPQATSVGKSDVEPDLNHNEPTSNQ